MAARFTLFLCLIMLRLVFSFTYDKKGKVVFVFNSQIQATVHVEEALRILGEMK